MTWWRKLKTNRLAQLGALLLILLYAVALGADFVAPYSPYATQINGSLLPQPTSTGEMRPPGISFPTSTPPPKAQWTSKLGNRPWS